MTIKAISAVKLPDGRVEVAFDDGDANLYYHPDSGAVVSAAGDILAFCGRLTVFDSVHVTLHRVIKNYRYNLTRREAKDLVQELSDRTVSVAARTKHVDTFVWEGKPPPGTPCRVPDDVVALWAAEATLTL